MGNLIYPGDFRLSGRGDSNHWKPLACRNTHSVFSVCLCDCSEMIPPKILGRPVLLKLADLCVCQLAATVTSSK